MKRIKIISSIALLLFINANNGHAQNECHLYSKILDSLYRRTVPIRIHVNNPEKIDPYNIPTDTTTAVFDFPYFVVIDEDFLPVYEFEMQEVVNAVEKYRSIKKLLFVQSKDDNLKNCDFSNISICFQKYKKGRDSIDFRAKAPCTFKGEHYDVQKKLFQFSRFLKSVDGNFLITGLYLKEFLNPWVKNYWDVVLRKTNKGWGIERLEISPAEC